MVGILKSPFEHGQVFSCYLSKFHPEGKNIASFAFQAWLDLHPLDLQEPTEAFEPEELLSKGPQLDPQ